MMKSRDPILSIAIPAILVVTHVVVTDWQACKAKGGIEGLHGTWARFSASVESFRRGDPGIRHRLDMSQMKASGLISDGE